MKICKIDLDRDFKKFFERLQASDKKVFEICNLAKFQDRRFCLGGRPGLGGAQFEK